MDYGLKCENRGIGHTYIRKVSTWPEELGLRVDTAVGGVGNERAQRGHGAPPPYYY